MTSYEFVAAGARELPAFTPGAHIDLPLPQDRVRSDSLANASEDRGRNLIAVRHETHGKGGSAWMHAQPRVGDRLRISPPVNDFPLAHEATGVFGACVTGVIEGEPDHRDDGLSEVEKRANNSVMICCSGALSKTLALDL